MRRLTAGGDGDEDLACGTRARIGLTRRAGTGRGRDRGARPAERALRAGGDHRRPVDAAGVGARGARQAGGGGAGRRRHLPRADGAREHGATARARRRSHAARRRAARLLLDQQGTLVAPRSRRALPPRGRPKPAQGGFYPPDATKAEVEAWFQGLAGAEREAATGFFTTIRRLPGGKLVAVPYSLEYQGDLTRAAGYLRDAAALTRQPTLKRFLELRAQALLSNDYYDSDLAWMNLTATIDPTIGPYEVYPREVAVVVVVAEQR